jgi:phosphate transport system substrate-binding protein
MNLFKKGLVLSIAAASAITGFCAETINGAGASFPEPVYRVWTYNYQKASGTRINYQSVGSGAGINQIKSKTVDFGASDNPLKLEELEKSGLTQFPMLMGGVVVIVNVPGIANNQLKLDGETLANIFLGNIKNWNDNAIAKLNTDAQLPELPITVVHRSDGSGTTWIFTDYLTKVSANWKKDVGCEKSVKWPVGIGGQKNPGVCTNVKKVNGSIGYVEYTYAVESKIPTAMLKNRDGNFVKPEISAFQAAGANADWQNAPAFYMELNDQPGKNSWPITGATFILIYKNQQNKAKAEAMLKYFKWCFTEGSQSATNLKYVPIPENVFNLIKSAWDKSVTADGKPVDYKSGE